MKLASLYSGGKDSNFAIYKAKKQGHDVVCLLTIIPKSEESHLLHFPTINWTKLQSKSIQIPQLTINSKSNETQDELDSLEIILQTAKERFHIEGLIHGGIQSQFQKNKFDSICKKMNLITLSPLWNGDPEKHMYDLLDSNFDFIITSVSSDGLNDEWLGKNISKLEIPILKDLSHKFGFNLNFEGGEAETFVVDCPLFSYPIIINSAKKIWDGYRGRFEILEAELDYHA